MAFNSVAFLFGLLPVTLLCYYLCPARLREGRNLILLLAGLGFYAWGGLALLPALLVSCLIN
jgi:alginate O-acetyltransferase complex protein AlgI